MKNEKDDKLSKLFREKFQNNEILPEADYWPEIEKALHRPSFMRFGWKHINIYNTSLVVMLLAALLYLFLSTDKNNKPVEDKSLQQEQSLDIISSDTAAESKKETEVRGRKANKLVSEKETKEVKLESTDDSSKIMNTKANEEIVAVRDSAEKPKIKKPKEVIYIIQQDTIVERDTVKVRRSKRK